MVGGGGVTWQEKDGNAAAGGAAELGQRRRLEHILDATRRILNASSLKYSIVCELHRFFIAVARTVVRNDGKRRHCS